MGFEPIIGGSSPSTPAKTSFENGRVVELAYTLVLETSSFDYKGSSPFPPTKIAKEAVDVDSYERCVELAC